MLGRCTWLSAVTISGMASFEQVAASFWHSSIVRKVQPPLTPEWEAQAQRELGVKLPEDLVYLLRIQNGGTVADEWSACPSDFYSGGGEVPFETVMGLAPASDAGGPMTMLDTAYLVQEWEMPSPIVLLDGDGHCWVALDYRACGPDGEPSVVWIDNERDPERQLAELQLAPSFRAFIEMLKPPDDDL